MLGEGCPLTEEQKKHISNVDARERLEKEHERSQLLGRVLSLLSIGLLLAFIFLGGKAQAGEPYLAVGVGAHSESYDCPEVCFDETPDGGLEALGYVAIGYQHRLEAIHRNLVFDAKLVHISALGQYERGLGFNGGFALLRWEFK